MSAAPALRGRLAPSPTGYMHLGNAWAFLLAWLAARSAAGQVVLRIEDIDPQRSRPEYAAALIEDLTWLGLDWDFGPDKPEPAANMPLGPYEQSRRGGHYAAAIAQLERAGLTYPCFCTRKELRSMAGAPHVDDAGAPYPGTCRRLTSAQREERRRTRRPALRVDSGGDAFTVADVHAGEVTGPVDDFVLVRGDGQFAYNLAAVVDDVAMGVTFITRGADLLSSAPRQAWLTRCLGGTPATYAHVGLVVNAEGRRLAKRDGAVGLDAVPSPADAFAAQRDSLGLGPCRNTEEALAAPVDDQRVFGGAVWPFAP